MSNVAEIIVAPGIVRRSDRGLCVGGTRITLYLIEDYLRSGWAPDALASALKLTEQQVSQVVEYLSTHRVEFDREYDEVMTQAGERERYWRGHERGRRKIHGTKLKDVTPKRAAAWARLNQIKRQEKRA